MLRVKVVEISLLECTGIGKIILLQVRQMLGSLLILQSQDIMMVQLRKMQNQDQMEEFTLQLTLKNLQSQQVMCNIKKV